MVMAKKGKNNRNRPMIEITRHLNKKGRIKGKNKQETKDLVASCPHFYYNKHGKKKNATVGAGDDYRVCKMCKQRIPLHYYSPDDVEDMLDVFTDINNQAKYLAIATNSGPEISEYFATQGIILGRYKRNYKRVVKIAKKSAKVKNKIKRKGLGSSSEYGSWGKIR